MYVSLTKITIVLCWLSLFSFWAIKLFGGNWFEIMVENENFVKLSNAVQNTWLKYLVSLITIVGGNYLLFGAIAQKFVFKGKQLATVICFLLSMWIVVNFIPNFLLIQFWYGYLITIIFGIITQDGWKKLFGVLAILLDNIFSILSMLIRNVSVEVQDNYLLLMIFIIDLYIMYGLYYLYSNLIRINKEI